MFAMTEVTDNEPPHSQKLMSVRAMAVNLMREHGLIGWSLTFDRARERAGICRRSARQIGLSEPLMLLWTEAQCRDTILHEIAHALAPPRSGHGRAWQRIAAEIGANPTRTWGESGEQEIPKRYVGTCPNGHKIYRDRRPRNASCVKCSPVFDRRYSFTWKDNG